MKSALTVVLFRLFTIGVCVDGYEESVSVTEGDSVTLKSGVTEIQTDDEIEWKFSGSKIATISRDDRGISPWVKPDGSFRDRLQLDNQTGDLKISNIRTTDSGEYKLQISSPRGSPEMTFTVKVVPAVVSAAAAKPVSLLVGDSVTLQTDLTDIQRDAVIQWRYGQQKSPVAEINRTAGIFNTYDGAVDGKFRGRLDLDHQTGSLTITNTRTTDSGLYEVEISSSISNYTIHHTQSFTVSVRADVQSVSVLEGDSVTLLTGLTGIQGTDQIVWTFGDRGELVADLNDPVNKKWTNTDLNHKTGDLTIRNIKTDQSGHYKVEINTRTMILHRKYNITIIVTDALKSVSVKEGETVTLPITEIQKDDLILWMFEDTVLAEINKADQRFYTSNGPDERFRDRLKLDNHTGSLNITDTRTTDSGLYELKISSSRRTINRRFIVIVTGLSPVARAGIGVVGFLLVAVGAGVIYYCCKRFRGLSPGEIAGIVGGGVLLGAVGAGVIYYCCKRFGGLSPGEIAGIVGVGVLLGAVGAGVIYYCCKRFRGLSPVARAGIGVGGVLLGAVGAGVVIYYCDKRFRGLSPGEIAGIVGGVLLVAVGAVGAGVIYYCCKRFGAGENKYEDPTFIPMLKKYPQAQPCKSDGSDPENI